MLFLIFLFILIFLTPAAYSNNYPYQTAFLYFLPDYANNDVVVQPADNCSKLGYTYNVINCAAPRILKDKCPTGNAYKTCYCNGSPVCSGSSSPNNPYPSSLGTIVSSCKDCNGNTLFLWSCSPDECSQYTLLSCPSNGNCTQCCNGKYKLNSCSSDYEIFENTCVCNKQCIDNVTTKPENSFFITELCSACGATTTINTSWKCNEGYTQSGDFCLCSNSCTDTILSKPENSEYTTTICTACGVTKNIRTGWKCLSGYSQYGNSCLASCNTGEWVYSDLSRSENFNSTKTPIAMIFGSHENRCYAMALNPIEKSVFVNFEDVYNYDTGSYNYSKVNTSLPDFSYEEAFSDFNGRENTNILTKELNKLTDVINAYKTAGTEAGQWFIGSAGETKLLMDNYETVLMPKLTAQGFSTDVRKRNDGTYLIQMWTSTEAKEMYNPMYSLSIDGYKNTSDSCGVAGNLFIVQTYYGFKSFGCWIGKDGSCAFENGIPSSNCHQGNFYPIIDLNSL